VEFVGGVDERTITLHKTRWKFGGLKRETTQGRALHDSWHHMPTGVVIREGAVLKCK
jgi:hypothetical protein